MTRRGTVKHLAVAGLWAFLLLAGSWAVAPAQITKVEFTNTNLDYDVLYLSDFIDVTTAKLVSNIANFSTEMRPTPMGTIGQVWLDMEAKMQLKGEAEVTLAKGRTNLFPLPGTRIISARDLAKGGAADVKMFDSQYGEITGGGKQKLDDYIKRFPSAPVGIYTITLKAYGPPGPPSTSGPLLGSTIIRIVVRNASPEEVVVTLLDPLPGTVLGTLVPTFSWSSPYPDVTLYVYEKLPSQNSAVDAVHGDPHLVAHLSGASTFMYPTAPTKDINTYRPLRMGHTYAWLVKAKVHTNRGDVERSSEVWTFRLLPPSQTLQELEDLLDGLGGAELGTLSTLLSMGWVPKGNITLDGITLSAEDVAKLLKDLAAKKTPVKARVE